MSDSSLEEDVPVQIDKHIVDPPPPAAQTIELPKDQTVSTRELYIILGVLIMLAAVVIVLAPFLLLGSTMQFTVALMAAFIACLVFAMMFV
jgi:hypothetical protein